MRLSAVQSVTALVALLAASACTLDFDQFEPELFPESSGSGSGGAGGDGGGHATTASTTSSGGTGGTGGTGDEHCLNGDDDDGDGAVDCADDDCGGFACVAVPEDWQGPGILYQGPAAADVACPEGLPTRVDVGGRDVLAAPATCSPCSCGAPSVECEAPALTVYGGDECDGVNVTLPVREDCINLGAGFQPGSYSAEAPDVDSAACPASGGEATLPPPRFDTEGVVCAPGPDTGGCAAAETCAPREIDAPFEQGICIWRDGERLCPEEFGERHVFASSVIDDRGCTPCTCDASGVACAATTLTLFERTGCRTPVEPVPSDGVCVDDPPPAASASIEVTGTGSCQPRGGVPRGEVEEGEDRITVCCAR